MNCLKVKEIKHILKNIQALAIQYKAAIINRVTAIHL